MSTPGSIGSAIEGTVQRLVDEAVGVRVVLAADVADRPGVEVAQRPLHRFVQLLHAGVFHFVATFDLAHDQLGVADQLEVAGAVGGGELDPAQQRPVLGDVVGRLADRLADFLDDLAAIAQHHPDRRRPRVAAGAAVDVDRVAAHRLAAGSPAMRSLPSSPTTAFHCFAGLSSWSISPPLPSSKTGRSSSPRSTPHWYQERSQAIVIRTSPGLPAEAPTEARGRPKVRVRPTTERPASLELKRAAACSKGVNPLASPGGGAGRRDGGGEGAPGRRSRRRRRPRRRPRPSCSLLWPGSGSGPAPSRQPSRSARATQSSQTDRSSSASKYPCTRSPARIVRPQIPQVAPITLAGARISAASRPSCAAARPA